MTTVFLLAMFLTAPTEGPQKVRPGSKIRYDEPVPEHATRQYSSQELNQRNATIVHYARLAQLDWMSQLATQNNDLNLQERIERVRRTEVERFETLIQLLHQQTQVKTKS